MKGKKIVIDISCVFVRKRQGTKAVDDHKG